MMILAIAEVAVLEIIKKNQQPNPFRIVEYFTMYANFRLVITCGSASRKPVQELGLIVNWCFHMSLNVSEWMT